MREFIVINIIGIIIIIVKLLVFMTFISLCPWSLLILVAYQPKFLQKSAKIYKIH